MSLQKLNPVYWIKKFDSWLDKRNSVLQIVIMLSIVFFIRTFFFGLYWVPTGSMESTMLVGESFFADKLTLFFKPIKRGDIISFNDPTFRYSKNSLMKYFQKYVWGPDNWTKRVIGIPGDKIQGKVEAGRNIIYLNGEKLDESYINPYPIVQILESAYQLTIQPPFMVRKDNVRLRTFDPQYDMKDAKQPLYNLSDATFIPDGHFKILYPKTAYYNKITFNTFDIALPEGKYWGMGDNRHGSFDSRGFGWIDRSEIHARIVFRLFSIDTPNSIFYEIFVNPIKFFTKKFRLWNRWFSVVK
jgi:signal peptidase I